MRPLRDFLLLLAVAWPVYAQSNINTSDTASTEKTAALDLRLDEAKASLPTPSVNPTKVQAAGKTSRFGSTTKWWMASSLAVYTASALDMHATEETADRVRRLHRQYPFFPLDYSFESNPLARPLLKLPTPAYYACGAALATGINWIGFRMSRSRRFHKVWWIPQALSVAGNTHGYLSYQ